MEAIAIVSLVASTASLAKVLTSGADALYAFSKASKVVNQTLESLYRETRALVQTIESVNVALSHLGTQHLNDIQEEHKGVWATLRDSVDNCCITAEEIDKELNSIKIKKCGFLTKPLRQYKLRLRDEGINRLRSQLSTHGQSLMLCLATINMIAGLVLPDRIIHTLSPKIDSIVQTNALSNLEISPLALTLVDESASISPKPLSTSERTELLREAAKAGRADEVSVLLSQGVAVDQLDASGHTALHYASINGHDEAVSILLSRADPNAPNEDGLTPLHLAAKRGLDSIVLQLLQCAHTNPNATNNVSETPLHHACYLNKPGCAAALVSAAADVNIKNKWGELPQHLCSFHGHIECTRALFDSPKVQPDGKNAWGETALHLASASGHIPTVEFLLEHANLDAQDNEGKTPLHLAAFKGNARMVEVLLKKANPSVCNDYGQLPVDIAVRKGFENVVEVLRRGRDRVAAAAASPAAGRPGE